MTDDVRLRLDDDSAFEHIRPSDRERVGYIAMTGEGRFVPFDLLHRQRGEAGELDAAEETLDAIGLTVLSEIYELERDGRTWQVRIAEVTPGQVTVNPVIGDLDPNADAVDLTARWTYDLPLDELRPARR